MKIAVIGNGPSALDYEAGKYIDKCDEVMRINIPDTSGYEKFVGSRTTMRAYNTNPKCIKAMHRSGKKYNLVLLCPHRLSEVRRRGLIKLHKKKKVPFDIVGKEHKGPMGEVGMQNHRCTAGFMAICYLMVHYPEAQIALHGFDAMSGPVSKKHYWSKKSVNNLGSVHNLEKEAEFYYMLMKENRVLYIPEEL